jgi:hypothetical protein
MVVHYHEVGKRGLVDTRKGILLPSVRKKSVDGYARVDLVAMSPEKRVDGHEKINLDTMSCEKRSDGPFWCRFSAFSDHNIKGNHQTFNNKNYGV